MQRKKITTCLGAHLAQSEPRTRRRAWRPGVLPGVFLLLFSTNTLSAQALLSALEEEISGVVKLARPAVVTVINITKGAAGKSGGLFEIFRDRQAAENKIKIGTGLIISSDGFILTKESVIRDAERIEVSLDDGAIYPADWVVHDSARGIALLKILGQELPHATIGMKNEVSAGSWITVIGNSLGVPHAVSVGVISAVQPDGMMQISANVDPGSNGSPVFNVKAEAIGIVAGRIGVAEQESDHEHYFGSTALVYNLAELMPFVQASIAKFYARHGWIGVTVVTDSLSGQHPRVLKLHEQGPGYQAGVQLGDIITHFNDRPVTSSNRLRELVMQVQPGQEAAVKVLRQNQELELRVLVSQKNPVALQELAAHRQAEIAPREAAPAFPQRSDPDAISVWLRRRLDALEKEIRTLQNYYHQNIYPKKN